MITKERRSRLREQWETESGHADEWRSELTEEEQYMVEVWDWTRKHEKDSGVMKLKTSGSTMGILTETVSIILGVAMEIERINGKGASDFFKAILQNAVASDDFWEMSEKLSLMDEEEGALS